MKLFWTQKPPGLTPENGDRIVEISCLELVNRLPSNQNFHSYINPECAMPPEAEKIHGLSSAFLADKPLFADIAEAFLQFIGDAPLIIHNAVFDIKFLNAELARVGLASLEAHPVRDTLAMARAKISGLRPPVWTRCAAVLGWIIRHVMCMVRK